ncbi:adhesion G-protein coupled receptor G4 [Trichomycterus rosablanca]|uniref:adhesion G-protein coupled receptor G4 n=1 Tax=Trichomycterus rosablanca TaxID=2290929 RepID=UPI002F35FF96
MINFLQDERVRDSPSVSRFDILAHLNVIPGEDVSKIQNEVFNLLKEKFNYSDHYLITDKDFLLVYPTDEDTTVVVPHSTPQTTTTMTSFTSTSTSPVTDSRSTEATDTTAVVPHSTPETTTTVTSFTSASTSSSPPTDSPSTEATGATDTTAVVPHSTPETTTLVTSFTSTSFTSTSTSPLTDSPSTEATGTTAVVSHSTPQTTTLRTSFTSTSFTSTSPLPSTEATDTTAVVPHSTPQTTIMVTNFTSTSTSTSPLTDSPSTEATGTTGTTVVVPHSTPQTTTTMTNFTSTSLTSTSPVTPSTEATESFFKVTANVTISGLEQDPLTTVQTWLHETFSRDEIQVLNIRITSQLTKGQSLEKSSYDLRAHFVTSARRLMCEFQVMVPSCSNVNETQNQIRHLLELPYRNGSVELLTLPDQVHIFLIEPGFCPSHIHQTRRGLYVWRQTSAQKQRRRPCQGDPAHAASRQCLLSATTNRAVWTPPDLHDCPTVVNTLSDLEQITVTNDTAVDVLEMIVDMMQESERLDERELWIVLNTLEAVLNVSAVTPDLAQVIVNITSDILTSQSDLQPFTNNILKITETVGDELSGFSGASVSMVAPALALSVVNVDPDHFYNLTFGAAVNNNPHPEVYINQDPAEGTVAFVTLPESIHTSFPQHSSPRVQFQFYGVPELFQDDQTDKVLNTYVVSASVINAVQPIKDLKVPVIVTLHHLNTPLRGRDVQCVYWNFNKNGGRGGWSPSGCWRYSVTDEYTTCMCDHLTHFGVLLDVSRTPIDAKHERILTLITYTGCGVSSFFLGVTVLTYTLLEKLRRDYPSQILLNLSIALLGLNLVFLVNSWLSSFGLAALCVAVATTQHYFLLASFIWMFLEAVNMYFALVKVFNSYVPSFILKLCTVGWGVPLLICCLVLVVKPDSYGLLMLQNSEKFCWVSDDVVFYVCVVGVVGVVLLVNGSVFLVVLVQVRRACVSERSGLMKELRGVTSLTLLLGLTWSAAFFTWGSAKVPLLYLFSILNSLQGFLIFVFQCLMKENVRKQWRLHLCFGCFKLQDYSEWSHTPPLGPKLKLTPVFRFPTVASFRSDKSSSTQSSSASSQSSQRQSSSPKRPDLGVVYQQGFLFPRAHAALPKSTEYDPQPLNWIPKEAPSADIYY